ncbi:aminotransferase class I/II-fold pyridoxal phosphate-dependent enzyme [Bacteroidota bacterium]
MNISDFKLERYFAEYEFNVKYLLCSSDCESLTIKDLLALEPGAEEKFHQQWLGYTEYEGNPKLREEIANIYENMAPENILVHSGAEEAIFLLMHSLLNAGDHVIVQWPCYQSLFEVANDIGCEISKWENRETDNWAPDIDELRNLIRSKTKLIVINSPHNPTGFHFTHEMFEIINRISEEKGIIIFSDEVYRESEYDIANRLPAACDLNPDNVSLGVMSKTYGLAGLRIGWIATRNDEIYNKIAALKDYTTICNSAPSEFLAELALSHRPKLIDRNLGIIKNNISLLEKFFDKHNERFDCHKPIAGPIAFPKLKIGDVEKFCKDLVVLKGVLLLPGTKYDDEGNHFRVGFGRKNMPEALLKLEEFLIQ